MFVFGLWAKKLSARLSKLHSTCPEKHIEDFLLQKKVDFIFVFERKILRIRVKKFPTFAGNLQKDCHNCFLGVQMNNSEFLNSFPERVRNRPISFKVYGISEHRVKYSLFEWMLFFPN